MPLSATLSLPARHGRLRLGAGHRFARGAIGEREEGPPRIHLPIRSETADSAPGSDEKLLSHYRDTRLPDDFAELHRRYSGELRRYLTRYLGDATFADDVLQDTFLRVHAKCRLYRDGWPVRPWLYAVASHRAVDALRSRGLPMVRLDPPRADDEPVTPASLLATLASAEPGPLEELQERERQRWVRESVAKLPEPQRQALVLAYDQGLSYPEIVSHLKIPLGTVKSRLHGAIARLRSMAECQNRVGSI